MTRKDDTQDLLRKLASIWCPLELTGFEFGLKRYRTAPPSAEVLQAVAYRKALIGRMQGNVQNR